MAETKDTLKAEVPSVCRAYCDLVWDEALNQAKVEASSVLRKGKSIYYPPAIRPLRSLDSKADPASSEVGEIQGSLPKAPLTAHTSSKGAEQAEDTIKTGDVNTEVVQGLDLPPLAPKDLSKEKETSKHGVGAGNSSHTPKRGS